MWLSVLIITIITTNVINSLADRPLCKTYLVRAFCVHYYLPCGNSTLRHVPQFLCPETCHYLKDDLCKEAWLALSARFEPVVSTQPRFRGFAFPDCDNPDAIISFLNLSADCCSNGGVTIPSNVTVTSTTFTTSIIFTSSLPQTQLPTTTAHIDVVGISVGSTVAVLIVLACIFICLAVFFFYLRKQKITNFKDAGKYDTRYTKNSSTNTLKAPSAGVHNDHALDLPVQSMHTHIEQLSNFLISKAQIQLIEILGQGIYHL